MENDKIQTYIDILNQISLTDVEKELFGLNMDFINNNIVDHKLNVEIKKLGEDGLLSLVQTIHYKHAICYLLTGNKTCG